MNASIESGEARAETILVVEDEVLIRLAIADFLRDCGYRVFEAGSVADARQVLASDADVDLVFSDVQMPGPEDGFALARYVRAERPGIRVIMTSGLAGAAAKATEICGESPLVEKPYDHENVLARIQALLRSAAA